MFRQNQCVRDRKYIASIDGSAYARMLVGAAASLAAHAQELNALNVFPVSDGDTGSNMLKTVEGGLRLSGKSYIRNFPGCREAIGESRFVKRS